jgi:hypothetical protein
MPTVLTIISGWTVSDILGHSARTQINTDLKHLDNLFFPVGFQLNSGDNLRQIKWNMAELTKFEKNFYEVRLVLHGLIAVLELIFSEICRRTLESPTDPNLMFKHSERTNKFKSSVKTYPSPSCLSKKSTSLLTSWQKSNELDLLPLRLFNVNLGLWLYLVVILCRVSPCPLSRD